ncbi:MAG: hypothetical protein AAGF67_12475, partial [Verrucomicrobiota bacterium]
MPIIPELHWSRYFTKFSQSVHLRSTGPIEDGRMKSVTLLILLALANANVALADDALTEARVSIPYQELKSLLEAAALESSERKEEPPVGASLNAALYRLDFSTDDPSFSASFEVRGFSENWHSVPLFGGTPRLKNEESADGVTLLSSEDGYALLAQGQGVFTSQVELTTPTRTGWSRGRGLEFRPAPASRSELVVAGLPEEEMLHMEGVEGTRNEAGAWSYHLPADGRTLRLFVDQKIEAAPVAPVTESRWILHNQVATHFSDGRLRHEAKIQAQAASGSGLSMSLVFPPQVGRVTVEGEDLETWSLGSRKADQRVARIHWKTRDTLDRTLLVSWEIPQSPLAETWQLIPPQALNPEDESEAAESEASRTLVAIVKIDGLELIHPDLAATVSSQRLPKWLRDQTDGADTSSMEIVGDETAEIEASWLPRMETAQATVSLARFETQLVADGSTLVMADYTIHHTTPMSWRLSLPSAEQILTCEINNQPSNPIQRGENDIEFRLAHPQALREEAYEEEEEAKQGTTV